MSGENTQDRGEIARRVYTVQTWMLEDMTTREIIERAQMMWKGTNDKPISKRQVERYITSARDGFAETLKNSIEAKRAYYIIRKKKLIRDMAPKDRMSASGCYVVSKILDSIAEMEGIKVRRHEITGKDGKPIETTAKVTNDIDYSQLSTEVLQAIVMARKKHID